jgi:hypothetical protein
VPYRILITKQVEKQLNALPQQIVNRVDQHIEALREDRGPLASRNCAVTLISIACVWATTGSSTRLMTTLKQLRC